MNVYKKHFLFAFSLIISSQQVLAGLGREVPLAKTPSQLCLLDYSKPEEESFSGICSGILLNSKFVLTAAHCLRREMPVSVRCGLDLKPVSFKRTAFSHPRYERNVIIDNIGTEIFDQAVIELDEPVKTQPLELISLAAIKDQQNTTKQCAFFGFSQLIGAKKETTGQTRGWKIDLTNITEVPSHRLLRMEGLKAPGALLQVGDSGGPLMCYHEGNWKLLGVNSSRDFYTRSNFVPASPMNFVREASTGHPTFLSSLSTVNSQRLDLLRFDFDKIKRKINRLKIPKETYESSLEKIQQEIEERTNPFEILNDLHEVERRIVDHLITLKDQALRLKKYSSFSKAGENQIFSVGDLGFNFFSVETINHESLEVTGKLRTLGPSDYFRCEGEIICDSQILENVTVSLRDIDLFMIDKSRVF